MHRRSTSRRPGADDPRTGRGTPCSSGVADELTALSRPCPRFESGLEHLQSPRPSAVLEHFRTGSKQRATRCERGSNPGWSIASRRARARHWNLRRNADCQGSQVWTKARCRTPRGRTGREPPSSPERPAIQCSSPGQHTAIVGSNPIPGITDCRRGCSGRPVRRSRLVRELGCYPSRARFESSSWRRGRFPSWTLRSRSPRWRGMPHFRCGGRGFDSLREHRGTVAQRESTGPKSRRSRFDSWSFHRPPVGGPPTPWPGWGSW